KRLTSPYQRSKTLFAPTFERWFVTTNGMRPCAIGVTLNSIGQVTPPSSDSKMRTPVTPKSTFGSSGETAIEQGPSGVPPAPIGPPVHVVPPSIERKCPSSPQTSTIPGAPACTTMPQMSLAGVSGVGSTHRQVTPESLLIATPQSVPTKTLFAA